MPVVNVDQLRYTAKACSHSPMHPMWRAGMPNQLPVCQMATPHLISAMRQCQKVVRNRHSYQAHFKQHGTDIVQRADYQLEILRAEWIRRNSQ